jgi:Uma2 family endonuclease
MTATLPPSSELLRDAADGRATLLPWTVEQYHWAISTGFLAEDPAYELLDGLIVRKDRSAAGEDPTTIGDRHRTSVLRLADLNDQFKPHGCFVQSQQPIQLPPHHEPEPDIAIVRGSVDNYVNGPPGPGDVLCVIEVADASLGRDRGVKLRAYAAAAIPLYVIVNLVDDQVEIYRLVSSGGYGEPQVLKRGATLRLPTASSAIVEIAVERLLI